MVVLGSPSVILHTHGKTVSVQPFSPDFTPLAVPLVDGATLYECPTSNEIYLLVFTNALSVPSMSHNLVPPFILREAGLVVRDVPKIHMPEPTPDDHTIFLPQAKLRIPLHLQGIFSYFRCRKPSIHELHEFAGNIYLLTPPGEWNPNTDAFAINEENMTDYEGNIIQNNPSPQRLILDDSPIPSYISDSFGVHSLIKTFASACTIAPLPTYDPTDPESLAEHLTSQNNISNFAISVGSTTCHPWPYLFDDPTEPQPNNDSRTFDPTPILCSTTATTRTKGFTAEHLSRVWRIDIPTAKRTIENTTQLCRRTENPTLSRNYSTNDRMLRYRRIHQHFFMDTFFATSKAKKSSRGNTCMQLFVTDSGFVHAIPLRSRSDVPHAVKAFAKTIGAPDAIICDASREQMSREVRSLCHKMGTTLRILEKDTPWSNRAELYIGLLKESVRKDLKFSNSPLAFWDYCAERRAQIATLTARPLPQLQNATPHYDITGTHGDISSLGQFEWYEWVYYREGSAPFPLPREVLGRTLGPARGEGNEMAQWILKSNGNVVPRRSVRALTPEEKRSETEKHKRLIFTELISKRWGDASHPPSSTDEPDPTMDAQDEDEDQTTLVPVFDDPVDANGQAIDLQPAYDTLIHAELMLPHNGVQQRAKVTQRTLGPDLRTTGTYHSSMPLNTMLYDVQFPDGAVKEYTGNILAEHLLNQLDDDGFTLVKLDSIIDHRSDEDALKPSQAYTTNAQGTRRLRKTTCGWELLVQWDDMSQEWVRLSELKEAYPFAVAEYATTHAIANEPAFAWWVPHTLRKRDAIVSVVRMRKTTHKYGIELPRSVTHAYELDAQNGNDFWAASIRKEMTNVGIAFEILSPGQTAPPGWSKASGHLVFDVKMSLERKSRWVLDGHLTADPTHISTFAGVVSRESVRIALTYAALNGIDVFAGDIRNAYLQAPSSQKDYIVCGPEFGLENVGRIALIRRALYGGKTAGRDFRNHLRSCMRHLGFHSCLADPDVWMRPSHTPEGSPCWEYVLLYTDDALVISTRAEHVLRNELGKYFELKEESIGPPSLYLGAHLRKVSLDNHASAWAIGSSQYVKAAIANVETTLSQRDRKPLLRVDAPLSPGYRPELDITPELTPTDASLFQSLIGTLRWIVELGRVDICCEVSMLSSHLALPREGHLEQLLHIFAYLKKYHNTEMVLDPSDPVIDERSFERKDWSTAAYDCIPLLPSPANMPEARGQGVTMRAFVDADHATDSMTRKSRTGFLVYVNSAPVYWLSKKQTGVETSSFGSEFIAMKLCVEYLRGLRYKLQMMGIPCHGPAYVYGDNKSVLANTTIPESTLKKKCHSISYHFIREGVARDEWRTTYINTHDNPADLLTKPLPSGEKRRSFVRMILHHIFGTSTVE